MNGLGEWSAPKLSVLHLSYKGFVSPLDALLSQLQSEGHDVSGARLEYEAMRKAVGRLTDLDQHITRLILQPAED
jgi:hypothetical protein